MKATFKAEMARCCMFLCVCVLNEVITKLGKIVRKITNAHQHYDCTLDANYEFTFSLLRHLTPQQLNPNSLAVCLWELRIKISMLSVSSAPHAAHHWKIKVISTCTINYIVTFMHAWPPWTAHLRMLLQTDWCPSPTHRKYRVPPTFFRSPYRHFVRIWFRAKTFEQKLRKSFFRNPQTRVKCSKVSFLSRGTWMANSKLTKISSWNLFCFCWYYSRARAQRFKSSNESLFSSHAGLNRKNVGASAISSALSAHAGNLNGNVSTKATLFSGVCLSCLFSFSIRASRSPERAKALTNYGDDYHALIVFNPPLFVCL